MSTQTMTADGPKGFGESSSEMVEIEGSDDEKTTVVTFGEDEKTKDKVEVVAEPAAEKVQVATEDGQPQPDDFHKFGQRAQKRIKTLSHKYQEQRTKREGAERGQAEAVAALQAVQEENQRLRTGMAQTNVTFADTMKERHEARLGSLQKDYAAAFSAGDAERAAEIQSEMAVVGGELATINQTRNSLGAQQQQQQPAPQQQQPAPQQQQPAQQQQPQKKPLSPKLTKWLSHNDKWFNRDDNRSSAKTDLAFKIHENLLSEGYDGTEDEYYEELDDRLKEVFPDHTPYVEGAGKDPSEDDMGSQDDPAANQQASALTPYSRQQSAGGGKRTVRLSPTEVSIAKRLGLTAEEYARSKLEEQNSA